MDLRSFLETLQNTGRGGGLFVAVLFGVLIAFVILILISLRFF